MTYWKNVFLCAFACLLLGGFAAPLAAKVLDDPGNLTAYKARPVGTTLEFWITGSTSGSIWGSSVYTLDSKLAVAAVHSGTLKKGETAIVLVTITEGRQSYDGTSRHDVRSSSWGSYEKSYRVERGQVPADPGNLTSHADRPVGTTLTFRVTGSTSGSIWGSDAYTLDSKLAVAAVHSGILNKGETAIVFVTITEGRERYEGTSRHGVTTSSWGSYQKSYKFKAGPAMGDPGNLTSYSERPVGTTLEFRVTGSISGSIWGSNVYTLDSKLAVAAVHAGVLKKGASGTVLVTIIEGRQSYDGTSRNGVTSSSWGSFTKSYKLAPANP